jgi:hypothetical protein
MGPPPSVHFQGTSLRGSRVLTHVRCLASPTDSSSRYLTLRTLALPTLRILARLGAVDLSPSRDCVDWRSVWVDRIALHKMAFHETVPYQLGCLIRQQFSHTAWVKSRPAEWRREWLAVLQYALARQFSSLIVRLSVYASMSG